MQKIVVTGNIGSGKSTITDVFSENHMPVFSADMAIQEIYQTSIEFQKAIYNYNPSFITHNKVDKSKIIDHLQENPEFIQILEEALYPILNQKRDYFIEQSQKNNKKMAIFEVPLLFEKNLMHHYDYIILLHAPYKIRLKRTLQRNAMTAEKFDLMNNRQINYQDIADKADLVIDTTHTKTACKELIQHHFF